MVRSPFAWLCLCLCARAATETSLPIVCDFLSLTLSTVEGELSSVALLTAVTHLFFCSACLVCASRSLHAHTQGVLSFFPFPGSSESSYLSITKEHEPGSSAGICVSLPVGVCATTAALRTCLIGSYPDITTTPTSARINTPACCPDQHLAVLRFSTLAILARTHARSLLPTLLRLSPSSLLGPTFLDSLGCAFPDGSLFQTLKSKIQRNHACLPVDRPTG